jgi:hypothetical protein
MNPPFWFLTILTGALPSSLVPGTGSAKGKGERIVCRWRIQTGPMGSFGDETVTALVNPLPAWPLQAFLTPLIPNCDGTDLAVR